MKPAGAMDQAREATGLDDFGPRDFEEGLARSLEAFAAMPLIEAARAAAEARIVADLATRLRIEQYLKDHPEVLDQPIDGPVLVFGLPRTGTTATVAMMALDPRFRFLRGWEAASPLPPPRLAEEAEDPRAVAARQAAASYANRAQHLLDPDGPEEDQVALSGLTMTSYHGAYPMPRDYLDWWVGLDFAPSYAYQRKVLQLLQSHRPPNLWLLKAPVHLFKLAAFTAEYPQARFVMTHRDPVKVIASDCSLRHRLHAERCRVLPDKTSYGPRLLAFWQEGMRRALAARAEIGEHRFLDVRNADVIARPRETFGRLYEALGYRIDAALAAKLDDYVERNARGMHGEHRYTPEEYGLAPADIRTAFADYIARFGL